jgi:hypothetical protein
MYQYIQTIDITSLNLYCLVRVRIYSFDIVISSILLQQTSQTREITEYIPQYYSFNMLSNCKLLQPWYQYCNLFRAWHSTYTYTIQQYCIKHRTQFVHVHTMILHFVDNTHVVHVHNNIPLYCILNIPLDDTIPSLSPPSNIGSISWTGQSIQYI